MARGFFLLIAPAAGLEQSAPGRRFRRRLRGFSPALPGGASGPLAGRLEDVRKVLNSEFGGENFLYIFKARLGNRRLAAALPASTPAAQTETSARHDEAPAISAQEGAGAVRLTGSSIPGRSTQKA